jgi:hypothetical protein
MEASSPIALDFGGPALNFDSLGWHPGMSCWLITNNCNIYQMASSMHFTLKSFKGFAMRYFRTSDDTCKAICSTCAGQPGHEEWAAWVEMDPATLDGEEPIHCDQCGASAEQP